KIPSIPCIGPRSNTPSVRYLLSESQSWLLRPPGAPRLHQTEIRSATKLGLRPEEGTYEQTYGCHCRGWAGSKDAKKSLAREARLRSERERIIPRSFHVG